MFATYIVMTPLHLVNKMFVIITRWHENFRLQEYDSKSWMLNNGTAILSLLTDTGVDARYNNEQLKFIVYTMSNTLEQILHVFWFNRFV